jgi:predicted protein tyrosine phosphatase
MNDFTLNRLANAHNSFQGKSKKVLCICSAGLLRSSSISWVLSNPPYNFNTRSAGADEDFALIPVDIVLLDWADEIVCAQKNHYEKIKPLIKKLEEVTEEKYDRPVHILDIPDSYGTRNPELIKIIEEKVSRIYKNSIIIPESKKVIK